MFRSLKVSCVFVAFVFISLLLLPTYSSGNNHGDIFPVTDFNNYNGNGEVPGNWKMEDVNGKADIRVVKEDIGHVFHLKSSGNTKTFICKEFNFDIKKFPNLNWQWKVIKTPDGAAATSWLKNDQAAQVYVVFLPKDKPERLGYIWDSSDSVGTEVESRFWKTWYVVIKSGSEGIGKWFKEKRNVYEDYKRLFSKEPPKAIGVAIMIDTDGTKGTAESFIGDIYFSKN